MAEKKLSDDMIKRIKELEGSLTADNENEVEAEIIQIDPDYFRGKYMYGGPVKRAKGSPPEGENSATMIATADRSGTSGISRGGGAAIRGIKFRGVR
jgi:hypothetical protein